jgi:hypothetical protein
MVTSDVLVIANRCKFLQIWANVHGGKLATYPTAVTNTSREEEGNG